MAKTTTTPPADTPAPPVIAGMTDADRAWVAEQIAAAVTDARAWATERIEDVVGSMVNERQIREWARREVALNASGVTEDEREQMNP